MKDFKEFTEKVGKSLQKEKIECLQINVGYICNLQCRHCHVEAGPNRKEIMSLAVIKDCLRFVKTFGVSTIDITGGAPEMNPNLRFLIKELRSINSVKRIMLRSNLVILDKPQYADLPQFFKENKVEIIASMPCYLEENVEAQRGKGVYQRNIKVLQRLNRLGYGSQDLKLNLVYNPGSNILPGPQSQLEAAYKENLGGHFGIVFNSLFTITNAPIGRFQSDLKKQGLLDGYMNLLAENFNDDNLSKVMCRNMVSVDWQGRLYDCDFNQALNMPIEAAKNIGDITPEDVKGMAVKIGCHCFTCTAGAGSSCQGSLDNKAV